MIFRFITVFIGASLLACSSYLEISGSRISVVPSQTKSDPMSEFLSPYEDSLKESMGEKIAETRVDLVKERPNSNLMKWAANAVFAHETKNIRIVQPIFCLLNTGGLRSSIGKGDVTVGDMFKLMPFDNTVVWVEFETSVLKDIEQYLVESGGEPISNAVFNGESLVLEQDIKSETFIVITSDYLYNGGDSMNFMQKGKLIKKENKKIRDIFIEEAKLQSELDKYCE